MEWKPATKREVHEAIDADWIGIDLALKARLAIYLVEPQPLLIERFGRVENAFIVARLNERVVFFDDVEGDFGTAKESEGFLCEISSYGNIALALRELEREGGDGN